MKANLQQPIKYHGGKSYLAEWIISQFPERAGERPWHLYREPYAGGLSVLLRLDPEGLSEAVNDLNRELSNFWRVLSSTPDRMLRELWATPLSSDVWQAAEASLADSDCVRAATAFFIRARQSRQGLMKDFATPTRRLRRRMNENVSAWLSAIEGLPEVHTRLKRVEVRNMDALEFIRKYDDHEAVFYCDPPYLAETRSTGGGDYKHEMTAKQHEELLQTLAAIKGRFLLSGYPSEMYHDAAELYGWRCVTKKIDNKASGAKTKPKQVECLWKNY